MYRNKVKNKKGFILIYTLIICSLCLIIELYMFKLLLNVKKVNSINNELKIEEIRNS